MRLTAPIRLARGDIENAAPDLAAVRHSTLSMTPKDKLTYGAASDDEMRTWLEACYKLGLREEMRNPRLSSIDTDGHGAEVIRMEFLVVCDEDQQSLSKHASNGRVVAYAELKYHPPKGHRLEKKLDHGESTAVDWKQLEPPTGVNLALRATWDKTLDEAIEAAFGDLHRLEIRALATLSPSHLRKGIATSMLHWIYPWADRFGVPIVLASTPPGYPMYLKEGFEELPHPTGSIECDLAQYGGEGVHRHVLMIRQPGEALTR
jgi:GNAT superfamily N-acetyltransferase